MKRGLILCALAWSCCLLPCGSSPAAMPASPTAAADADAKQIRTELDAFYRWYLATAVKSRSQSPAWIVAVNSRPIFSARLARALKEDAAAQARVSDDIVGLDFDPVLNAQDRATRYLVGAPSAHGPDYWVPLHRAPGGSPGKDLVSTIVMAKENGRWVIANFRYPDSSDLLGLLAAEQGERQKNGTGRRP